VLSFNMSGIRKVPSSKLDSSSLLHAGFHNCTQLLIENSVTV
jgi:hypothetical protein